jgi:hypothetical protein
VFIDPGTAPEKLLEEEGIARRAMCKHRDEVKELKEAQLWSTDLREVWSRNACESIS